MADPHSSVRSVVRLMLRRAQATITSVPIAAAAHGLYSARLSDNALISYAYFRIARQNEAAGAADAAACTDTGVGTALLKNGWCRR